MAPEPQPRGLLLDWGGVLTSDVFAGFQLFCEDEGLDPLRVRELFAADPDGRQALVELETGVITEPEFEIRLAALLELGPDRTPGLVDRVFGSIVAEEEIFEALRIARAAPALLLYRRGHRAPLRLSVPPPTAYPDNSW